RPVRVRLVKEEIRIRAAGRRNRAARRFGLVRTVGCGGEADIVHPAQSVDRARGHDLTDLVRGENAGLAVYALAIRIWPKRPCSSCVQGRAVNEARIPGP